MNGNEPSQIELRLVHVDAACVVSCRLIYRFVITLIIFSEPGLPITFNMCVSVANEASGCSMS